MISKPIFLVGARRSGTTLFRLMLDHHPEISWHHKGFEYAFEMMEDNEFPSLNEYYEWLVNNRIFQLAELNINKDLTYPELIDDFLYQIKIRDNKQYIGATVHLYFDKILEIYPDAIFIHITRDPRGVACSNIGLGWAGNGWGAAQSWLDSEKLWSKLKGSLSSEQYIEITYESLIRETKHTLVGVCEFIGCLYDERMMSYVADGEPLPDPKMLDKWKSRLSKRDIQLIEAALGGRMKERGYELSGPEQLKLTLLEIKILEFSNRASRAYSRLKRIGIYLFISDFLSRRLHCKQWQYRVTAHISKLKNK